MSRNTAISRTGVDSSRSMVLAETSAMAMAEREKHRIQARYQVALMRPRNIDDVRTAILAECKRPGFAAVARYRKPIGKGIEGPSIRYVECAIALMGNMESGAQVVYDDDDKRLLEVAVTDLERNASHSKTITVTKTVERSSGKGRIVISERVNSYNKAVFVVVATDDELQSKEASLVSKAVRTCGLRLIPKWLTDEAMDQCKETARDRHAKDPDAARKEMVDAWSAIGVTAAELAVYLGHPLSQMTPDDYDHVLGLYNAVDAGETSWATIAADSEPVDGEKTQSGEEAYYTAVAPIHEAMKDEENPDAMRKMKAACVREWRKRMGHATWADKIALDRANALLNPSK